VSGFLRNIVMTKTFDGDEVTMVMSPLTLGEVLSTSAAGKSDVADIAAVVMPIMERHLVSVAGLRANDGTPVTKEELLSSAYFTRLIVDGGMELLRNAHPKNPLPPAP
jgi:hypothetical protein